MTMSSLIALVFLDYIVKGKKQFPEEANIEWDSHVQKSRFFTLNRPPLQAAHYV